ncbi:MAG: hypothetical protein Q8L85_02375 [Alphaproteobacteria bacterium]|nr:hypothetical protein [Alphaproteobacteria bacterium]
MRQAGWDPTDLIESRRQKRLVAGSSSSLQNRQHLSTAPLYFEFAAEPQESFDEEVGPSSSNAFDEQNN